MKRILAIALSVAMILVVFLMAGCGGNGDNETTKAPDNTTGSQDPSTTGGNQPEQTTGSNPEQSTPPADTTTDDTPVDPWPTYDGTTKAPGFEDVDFRGKTFVIAGETGTDERWDSAKEIYAEDASPISVAVRNRNLMVEKLYNCKIELKASDAPSKAAMDEVTGGLHTIDMYTNKYNTLGAYTNGNNYNLYTLGIDFSHDWWDQNFVNTYTVKDNNGVTSMYSMVGDFSLSAFAATHALMFNKSVMDNSSITDNVYDLVREGKWTMDKFVEMIKAAAKDENGNSTFAYADGDIMGWLRTGHATHGMHAASALPIISNENGTFKFSVPDNAAAWTDIIDKAREVWGTAGAESTGYTSVQNALQDGKTLFGSEVLDVLERMKDADTTIGLLPYPKYSESQENYAHYVDNHLFYYCVPTSVEATTELGQFIELYACHSKYLVRPIWIDTYCYEYCGDSDSADMLEIILNSRTYDPAYLGWATVEADVSHQIDGNANNITRWMDRNAATINTNITTFLNDMTTKNQ